MELRCPYCGAAKLTWLAKAKVYRCYGDHNKAEILAQGWHRF